MSNELVGYVVIGNKPHKIIKWKDGVWLFDYNGKSVWYDALRDGPVVTEAEAAERYPEWML